MSDGKPRGEYGRERSRAFGLYCLPPSASSRFRAEMKEAAN
jgi:hypothetical protein